MAESSPIVDWLRALSRKVHAECGGRGVGAVGMCFTGNFALAMTEPSVVARRAVPNRRCRSGLAAPEAAIGVSPEEIAVAKRRFAEEDLTMIGLRFRGDPFVSDSRFDNYKQTFGDRFLAIKLMPKTVAAFRESRPFRAHRQLA